MNKTLNECLSLIIDKRGVTPKKLSSDWTEEGYRVLSANNVKTSGLQKIDEIRCVNEETYRKWMREEVCRGDILLTSEAPAGEVLYWDSDEKIVSGQRLYVLRTNDEVDALYLKYYLQSSVGQQEIRNKCSGSTVFGISAKTFDSIKVNVPDSKVKQKKISGLLYNLDKKIENNNKIISELESMAKTIYDYWFLQFDFPDENGKPYKASGGKMVWNEELKREIPEGWEVKELGELFETNRGVSYSSATLSDSGTPMINLATFTPKGGYNHNGLKFYSGEYNDDKVIHPYDLVMCNTQQTAIDFSKDIIGRVFLVPDIFDGDIVSSHHVNSIKVFDDNLKYYLCYLFNSDFFHKYISGYTNGTNILGLVFSGVEKYRCEIPPKKLLEKFANIVISAEKEKSKIIKENQELASLRDWLLPMLMNGQVTFKDEK